MKLKLFIKLSDHESFKILLILLFCFTSILRCLAQPGNVLSYVLYDDLTCEDISKVREKLEDNWYRLLKDFEIDTSLIQEFNIHIWHDKEGFLNAMEKNIGYRYEYATGYIGYSDIYILFIDNPEASIQATGLLYCFTPEEIAEHELAHSLSLRVNHNFSNNPRWFWEVVAIYESEELYNPNDLSYLKQGKFPTINELNKGFEQGDYRIYQVGYLIGEYIVSEWGKSGFIDLIKDNGNIENSFGITVKEFENGWKEFLEDKYFQPILRKETISDEKVKVKYKNGMLNIQIQDEILTDGFVQIFDLNGKQISSFFLAGNSATYHPFDNAEPGHIYIIVITSKGFNYKAMIWACAG